MKLEIIDVPKQKRYIGSHGSTIVTADFHIISVLQSDNDGYVVEVMQYYTPIFLQANIKTVDEAKAVISPFLLEQSQHLLDQIAFKQIKMIREEGTDLKTYPRFEDLMSIGKADTELTQTSYEVFKNFNS